MPPLTLQVLAHRVGGRFIGDPELLISGVAELATARSGELAPFWDDAYSELLPACRASALLVAQKRADLAHAQLISPDPRRALGILIELLAPVEADPPQGVASQAVVDPSARVDSSAWIGPFTYVGPGASIGPRARIEPFSYIGSAVRVGADSHVGPGATILEGSAVGARATLGPGCVVGQQGFGFWRGEQGWHRVRSQGRVELADDVELGANSCVDRATLGETTVGEGAKIDNLVQVGHNIRIGDRALLCAQVGLSGSVTVGEDCLLGGQAGVADHLTVGDGARIGAGSGVVQDIPPRAAVTGYPAQAHRQWLRSSVLITKLPELYARVRELGRQIERLRPAASSGDGGNGAPPGGGQL